MLTTKSLRVARWSLPLAAASGVIALLASSPAAAQCSTGVRGFATIGGGGTTAKVRVLPGTSRNGVTSSVGSELGRFWRSDDSREGNNFLSGDPDFRMDPAKCPTQGNSQASGGWWQITQTNKRGINGFVSGTGCLANSCPAVGVLGDITVVVEDYGPSGPPGVNDTAHFIGFRVDETPGGIRWWDLARVAPPETDLLFIEFPVTTVTSSFKQGTDRVVTMNFANVAFHVHGQSSAGPLPSTSIVASYDLMVHTGDTDPGRLRYQTGCAAPNPGGRCWTLVDQIPFTGSSPQGVTAVIPCESVTKDSFIALGISFRGGAGPNVPSSLVGRAVQIECDPNLAEPPKPRPAIRLDDRAAPAGRTPARSRGGR